MAGGAECFGASTRCTYTRVQFVANEAKDYGGAVIVTVSSFAAFNRCNFVANRAATAGAIYVNDGSEITVKNSFFRDNVATQSSGAAIAAQVSSLVIEDTSFIDNAAPGVGAALYLDRPTSVKILHTTFSPLLDGAGTVFLAGRLGGCEMHPCDGGHSCSYAHYSLTCTPCEEYTMSPAPNITNPDNFGGIRCVSCGAGLQPNSNQSGCIPCTGNQFSISGKCEVCIGQTKDHKQCQECPLNQVADPPEQGCRCKDGYYNTTAGEILCYSSAKRVSALQIVDHEPRSTIIKSSDKACKLCPDTCVDCMYAGQSQKYLGRPLVKPGYATAEGNAWFERGTRVVFECPVHKVACLGEALVGASNSRTTVTCADGYDDSPGVLCATCISTHVLDSEGCSKCTAFTAVSAVIAGFFGIAFIAIILITVRTLRQADAGTKIRALAELTPELISDFKVFIGLYQILCSMGQSMQITYPASVETFLSSVRSIANFDAFALPGMACRIGGSVISRFWVAIIVPPLIALTMLALYLTQTRNSQKHISDVILSGVSHALWEQAQSQHSEAHFHEYSHEDGGWQKIEKSDLSHEQAAAKIQATFRGFQHRKREGGSNMAVMQYV
eukprot:COSAG05_NODE_9_length_39734_cov_180.598067_23_plen_613_part_00